MKEQLVISNTYNNLFKKELSKEKIENETISGSKIEDTKLKLLEFIDINFQANKFQKTSFISCRFENCSFSFTDFINCNFKNCEFINCEFTLVHIRGSKLTNNTFTQTKWLYGVEINNDLKNNSFCPKTRDHFKIQEKTNIIFDLYELKAA